MDDQKTTLKPQRYRTYAAFFDFYLCEHTRRATRAWHYAGSTLGILALIIGLLTLQPVWILGGLVTGYACAWIGHTFVEKNRPATFTYPLWSFMGDYHMYYLWLRGRLDERLKAARFKSGRRSAKPYDGTGGP